VGAAQQIPSACLVDTSQEARTLSLPQISANRLPPSDASFIGPHARRISCLQPFDGVRELRPEPFLFQLRQRIEVCFERKEYGFRLGQTSQGLQLDAGTGLFSLSLDGPSGDATVAAAPQTYLRNIHVHIGLEGLALLDVVRAEVEELFGRRNRPLEPEKENWSDATRTSRTKARKQ
jgi:hypothetical protein